MNDVFKEIMELYKELVTLQVKLEGLSQSGEDVKALRDELSKLSDRILIIETTLANEEKTETKWWDRKKVLIALIIPALGLIYTIFFKQ